MSTTENIWLPPITEDTDLAASVMGDTVKACIRLPEESLDLL